MANNIKKEYKGFKIELRPEKTDALTFQEVIKREGYAKKFKIEKGDKFLDIGTHIGLFSIYCLANGAEVVGYEPEKNNYKMAIKNINGQSKVHNKAVVGNDDKFRDLCVNDKKGSGMHSFFRKRRKNKQQVECVNINKIIKNYNGLKIDTKGAELEIIRAIDNFKNINKIVMEYHFNIIGKKPYMEIINKLKKHGFKVYYRKLETIGKNWNTIISAVKE